MIEHIEQRHRDKQNGEQNGHAQLCKIDAPIIAATFYSTTRLQNNKAVMRKYQ